MKVKTIKIVIDCSKLPHYDEYDSLHTTSRLDNSHMYEIHQVLERLAHDIYWADEAPTSKGEYSITHAVGGGTQVGTLTLEEAE